MSTMLFGTISMMLKIAINGYKIVKKRTFSAVMLQERKTCARVAVSQIDSFLAVSHPYHQGILLDGGKILPVLPKDEKLKKWKI